MICLDCTIRCGQCLGGRVQPIGDDFNNSSIKVLAGAEQVPGVADALVNR